MADEPLHPRSGTSAKALLLTVLGELVLPRGGHAWTGALVDTLALVDVEEGNARQALARTADQGFLRPERRGRRVRWHLTDAGRSLLTAGTRRIYGFGGGVQAWDERWLVVLCSVPDDQRAKRRQLRARLGFAGFGFLTPGVALTPHLDREPLAAAVLRDVGLADAAVVLRAEAGALVPAPELLRRAWDVDDLGASYRAFIEAFARRQPRTDESRLAALVALVHEWRRFPFVDPELPASVLPADWPGAEAKALFDRCHARWVDGARAAFGLLDGR